MENLNERRVGWKAGNGGDQEPRDVKQIIRVASDQLHQNGAEWTKELGVAPPDASESDASEHRGPVRATVSLHDEGVINEEDYETQKHSILSEL